MALSNYNASPDVLLLVGHRPDRGEIRMRGKLSGIAAAAAVAAAIAVPVTGASASTSRCTEGVMQPQCGDFVNQRRLARLDPGQRHR
jgi:hypothetical protein